MNIEVSILEVGPCIFQMVGKSDQKENEVCLFKAVMKLAELAEVYKGVPIQTYPHILPAKFVVHATYQFRSEIDAAGFLQECKNVTGSNI